MSIPIASQEPDYDVDIHRWDHPGAAFADENITTAIEFSSSYSGTFDDFGSDYCTIALIGGGREYRIEILMDGSVIASESACFSSRGFDPIDHAIEFDYQMPAVPGTNPITLRIVGEQSGDVFAERSTVVSVTGTDCSFDGECPPGQSCENGICTPECSSNADCDDGHVCINGQCIGTDDPEGVSLILLVVLLILLTVFLNVYA